MNNLKLNRKTLIIGLIIIVAVMFILPRLQGDNNSNDNNNSSGSSGSNNNNQSQNSGADTRYHRSRFIRGSRWLCRQYNLHV